MPGRLGAYAERAANEGCLVIIIGGGGRQNWRQVAPYGGKKALLPTNPFCFGIPGGQQGPVIVDFATSMIAGGWLYAARAAGGKVPFGTIINSAGELSDEPDDYFNGGAILPKGGAMGYGLAVMAELICEAMLGPVTTEVNWLIMAIDTTRYREPHIMMNVAEVDELLQVIGHVRTEIVTARAQFTRGQFLVADVKQQKRLHAVHDALAATVQFVFDDIKELAV